MNRYPWYMVRGMVGGLLVVVFLTVMAGGSVSFLAIASWVAIGLCVGLLFDITHSWWP